MHRYVYRAYVHFYNALDFVLGNIGKGYIIAEKKGKARVIVLKIKAFAHSGRQLVYKAENALIAAGVLLIHKVGFKFKPQLIVFPFFNFRFFNFSRFVNIF